MPRLDDRLKAVAQLIRSEVHADIGSDHGHLLKALLAAGRIDRAIAIENKQQPFANSRSTLAGLDADVRLADGLNGLAVGEADSLSICGMGGPLMVEILQAFPDRVPAKVVLQPNRETNRVRQWGWDAGFHLIDEQMIFGERIFEVLSFEAGNGAADPAYQDVDRSAALQLGPHHLKRWTPKFADYLVNQRTYLQKLHGRNESTQARLDVIVKELTDRS